MAHWKLTLAYDGSPYNGWQIQPNLPTVQGMLSDAIHRITGERVLPQGSGRTDTGVHALGQVASFTISSPIPPSNLQRALNHVLPPSIRIISAEEVAEHFHARHNARSKTYEYRIATQAICLPMLAPFVWNCTWPLDVDEMQEAASLIIGEHDFTSFAATDPEMSVREPMSVAFGAIQSQLALAPAMQEAVNDPIHIALDAESLPRNFVRTIYRSSWHRCGDVVYYRVTGSGFLHHMVRNLVGTFVDVGRGRTPAGAMPDILEARTRTAAGPTAPPQGLFLMDVHYADEDWRVVPPSDDASFE
jgi:tRNA pseudouridine38-40 synthase